MDSKAARSVQNVSYTEEPDCQLVRMCQGGDHEAFAELMRRHQSTAYKLGLSILREKLDAEDEVQNSFWKAFEHINQFQQHAKFSTWLTRIVVNQCLMRLRQSRQAKFYYLDDTQVGEDVVTLDLPDRRQTPEQELGQTEVAQVLNDEICRIPPLLRHVFMLRDVQQLSMPDVAEMLGISVAAAKSRLLRARSELRVRMQRHGGRTGAAALFARG